MGDPASTRSDVWGLGVVLHEILFGGRPEWERPNRGGRRMRSLVGDQATGIERAAAILCERCTAEYPSDRPKDAAEIARGGEDRPRYKFTAVADMLAAAAAAPAPPIHKRVLEGLLR